MLEVLAFLCFVVVLRNDIIVSHCLFVDCFLGQGLKGEGKRAYIVDAPQLSLAVGESAPQSQCTITLLFKMSAQLGLKLLLIQFSIWMFIVVILGHILVI